MVYNRFQRIRPIYKQTTIFPMTNMGSNQRAFQRDVGVSRFRQRENVFDSERATNEKEYSGVDCLRRPPRLMCTPGLTAVVRTRAQYMTGERVQRIDLCGVTLHLWVQKGPHEGANLAEVLAPNQYAVKHSRDLCVEAGRYTRAQPTSVFKCLIFFLRLSLSPPPPLRPSASFVPSTSIIATASEPSPIELVSTTFGPVQHPSGLINPSRVTKPNDQPLCVIQVPQILQNC
jgi:hypothetical protein